MFYSKKKYIYLSITLLFLIIPMAAGAVNFNQNFTLKEDGSGSVNILYVEQDSFIKGKNFLIGNLPFNKEKITEYFSSAGTKIFSSSIEKSPKDNNSTQVIVTLVFNSVNDLNNLKGLTKSQYSMTNTDSGMVLRCSFSPEFVSSNSISQIYCTLTSKSEIKSSNGTIKDNAVSFFRGKEYLDSKNGNNFDVTFKSGDKTTTTKKEGSDEKGKSCGLFGIELPIVFLLGSVLMYSNRKRNKKN